MSSEQHVELRHSREIRDVQDVAKLPEWLIVHPPMSESCDLMSLSTGAVADKAINCDTAAEIGTQAMKNGGQNFWRC